MYVRTSGKDARKAIAAAGAIWKKYNPGYDFLYSFLDSSFDELYKTDLHVGQLFNCFAALAIFISCLGLFGLVTFTAESKSKEIGVRKVLGADIPDIVSLLSKDFLVLVAIASGIAFPLAWFGLRSFLQGFVYRTDMSWWVFAASGMITVFIAMMTVGFRCLRAAMANPVTALRSE